MIHARKDYNRIQDPAAADPSLAPEGSTPIGADEPVFLLRARDMCAPAALLAWAQQLEDTTRQMLGSEAVQQIAPVAKHVREWAEKMRVWGLRHGSKLPDTPAEHLADTAG